MSQRRVTRRRASNEDDESKSTRAYKADQKRIKRGYHAELNLVEAFEAAASGDLAHHLFGFALERVSRSDSSQEPRPTDEMFRNDGDRFERTKAIRTSHAWAAWPCQISELPESTMLSAPWTMDSVELRRGKRKLSSGSVEIADALSSIAMETARHSMQREQQKGVSSRKINGKRKKTSPGRPDLTFMLDEDQSMSILHPLISKVKSDTDKLMDKITAPGLSPHSNVALLDWMHVLSTARDLGWSAKVVEAAIARCSAMFGGSIPAEGLARR